MHKNASTIFLLCFFIGTMLALFNIINRLDTIITLLK